MKKEKLERFFKVIIILCLILIGFLFGFKLGMTTTEKPKTESPEVRVMCGNYYNWQVIETVDGNIWQINCEYDEGQLVQVMFDTKGTETVVDDEIMNIKEVK